MSKRWIDEQKAPREPRTRGAAWASPVGRYQSKAGRLRLSLQPVLLPGSVAFLGLGEHIAVV